MRADRLLSILLLLQSKGRMTAQSLAQRLEVSERTILRDMDALSGAGVPVIAERGARGGWRLIDGYQTKLTGLTSPEIQTLFLGRPPKVLADLGLKDAAEAAWIKLQAALPSEVREQAEFVRQRILIDPRGWREATDSITPLPVVLDALWRNRRLKFIYERAPEPGYERTVDPLGLVARGSAWYLVAARDAEIRTYRISRIRDALVLEQPCTRPVGFDLAAHWEASATAFREQLPRFDATFLVEPSVMEWIRWYRGSRVKEEPGDGERVRVRVRFDAEHEAVMFALSFAVRVELVEPAYLRPRIAAEASATAAHYAPDANALPAT
jgi:predicted DNA-binding transcriptional regulator YafY